MGYSETGDLMNEQRSQGLFHEASGLLSVHRIFDTIQGEGPFVGRPAVFVRLAGCNLQCPMCDTDYTSDARLLTVEGVLNEIADANSRKGLVVITGGEPFRQNLKPLVFKLLLGGWQVQIETNGTLFVDLPFDHLTVVCSPKAGKISAELAPHIRAFKYVLHADSICEDDGLPRRALGHPSGASNKVARPPHGFTGPIYVQPVDVGDPIENARHLQAAIGSAKWFDYTLCVQVHKIINVE